ncbi:hypothetical protein SARC_13533 [Sphaeroforma arctica JP610]|uniref:Uncharacterized protein n=1 Tax=Sphaeroforma arctica JP610 TaxID=667725 RepID=A0A0L0FBM9_9EUKA|nr:hypothetical protein SARC_13533 [Sphaeroforma arctica JP610]KNC73906.1 hypothetical protein SARC_13533 [Sphaeroforma arctica JP610]|eukprot:XP_014147808.1 hypothetical protein SARC_13533 [Sphaeroforma arctica JP610]
MLLNIPVSYFCAPVLFPLYQVEDMFKPQENAWVPSLAMFGGKVALNDEDWRHTAAREFQEEVGYILGDKESGVPKKMSEFSRTEVDVAKAYTSYLAISKYQLLEYPIEPEDIDAFLQLPKEYWNKYKGEVRVVLVHA